MDEMIRRRHQILGMTYEMRSLNYLLEEKKLRECGLLGEKDYTNDGYYTKYSRWDDVSVPRSHVDFVAGEAVPSPIVTLSPAEPSTILAKRTAAEQEGMAQRTLSLWSPTLLRMRPNRLASFPGHPDHNFMIWSNVDLHVH